MVWESKLNLHEEPGYLGVFVPFIAQACVFVLFVGVFSHHYLSSIRIGPFQHGKGGTFRNARHISAMQLFATAKVAVESSPNFGVVSPPRGNQIFGTIQSENHLQKQMIKKQPVFCWEVMGLDEQSRLEQHHIWASLMKNRPKWLHEDPQRQPTMQP